MEKQAAPPNQSPSCDNPEHQDLSDTEDQIHSLIHQGMDAVESGQLALAEAAYHQALALAQHHRLPRWEAQARFFFGTALDHAGKYIEAIPWFEEALKLYQAEDSPRMEGNVGVFLANMLTKTGQPTRALAVLEQAKRRVEEGHTQGRISLNDYEYERSGLYREFGCAYRGLKEWETA